MYLYHNKLFARRYEVEIKRLNINQIEEIKAFFKEIFMNEPWNDDWSDEKQLHQYMIDLTGNSNSLSIGLYDSGELIGISLGSIMHWYTGTEYYIYEFCVKREKQNKGMGKFFLNEIEKYVTLLNINHIFLQTERNVPAYKFYMNNGFSELKEHVSLVKIFD